MNSRKITIIVLSALIVVALAAAIFIFVKGDELFGTDDFKPISTGDNGNINVGGYVNEFPTEKPDDVDVDYKMDYLSEDLTKYIKLGEYKGLKVSAYTYEVTDAIIEEELAAFMEEYSDYEHITNRKTAEGDTIVVDYTGLLDGVAFQGGSATNSEITLDKENNGYIPGFIDGMYDVMPGNTVEYEVTFPVDYGVENLNGQTVVFKVKVDYILGDYVTPELTDEFVTKSLSETGCKNVSEFMLYFKGYVNDKRREELKEQVTEELLKMLTEGAERISLPEKSVESRYWYVRQMYENYANTYDMEYAEFLEKNVGKTDTDIRKEAEDFIFEDLIIYSVIKAEGLELGEDEYKAGLDEYAEVNKTTAAAFEEYYGKAVVWDALQYRKMIDFVFQNAEIEEIIQSGSAEDTEPSETEE